MEGGPPSCIVGGSPSLFPWGDTWHWKQTGMGPEMIDFLWVDPGVEAP